MIVLAVIAAVIVAILLIPIKIFAVFRGSLKLWVKVLFLRIDILPKKEKAVEAVKPDTKNKLREEYAAPEPARPSEPPERKEQPREPERTHVPGGPDKEENKKLEREKERKKAKKKPPEPKKAPAPAAEAEEAEETAGFVDKSMRIYETVSELFGPFQRAIKRLLKVSELNVDVRVGTMDAADTAVYAGMLWAVAGNLLGLASRFVRVQKPNIRITPAYNETVLAGEGDCIICTNLGNIIGAAAIAAVAWLRYKSKSKKTKREE